MKDTKQVKKFKTNLYAVIIVVNFLLLFASYYLMPIAQNFPEKTEDLAFQKLTEPLDHIEQYSIIFLVATSLHILLLKKLTKRTMRCLNKIFRKEKVEAKEIHAVRQDCINIPNKFYLIQIAVMILITAMVTLTVLANPAAATMVRFLLMAFSIISLMNILQLVFIQRELRAIIRVTYMVQKEYKEKQGTRMALATTLMTQMLPFLIASVVIISLVGYAKATQEKGKASANYYKAHLDARQINKAELIEVKDLLATVPLNEPTDYYFIIPPNDMEPYVSNIEGEVTEFAIAYLEYFGEGIEFITYEFYGIEEQSYTKKILDENGDSWYIGFKYSVKDESLMMFYLGIMMIIVIVYAIMLYFWANSISRNVLDISDVLRKIVDEKKYKTTTVLPILSNDELGDLADTYNKIEKMTVENLQEIEQNRYVMERQAQFSVLGEFAGGLAHDLNSPLSAVKMDIGTLKRYINSDKVNAEEHITEKLNEMFVNIESSLANMSDTVKGVRNQIRSTGDVEQEEFTIYSVLEGIKIILRSVCLKCNCELVFNVDEEISIVGEKNKLDRVLTNLIKNALDAYSENKIKGRVVVECEEHENSIEIGITDTAGGIAEEMKDKIFKEMKTTRKENGTGFGLYYSNTIIEGVFKGKMSFDTKDGVGTTFYIELPKN